MKNLTDSLKQKLTSKYTVSDSPQTNSKRTDINVLLNRVKSDKKQEVIKKFYFSAAASTGLILFEFKGFSVTSISFGVSILLVFPAKPLVVMNLLKHNI